MVYLPPNILKYKHHDKGIYYIVKEDPKTAVKTTGLAIILFGFLGLVLVVISQI